MKRKNLYYLLALLVPALLLIQMKARQHQSTGQPLIVTINAIAGLQFDKVRFWVKPGTQVKIILKNADDMSHNLVFTKPGKRLDVVNAALKLEEKGPGMNYIPDSPDVLWAIPVLSPGQEQSITFTAPEAAGVYPFVCTFPGHGFAMYGAMYVSDKEQLPPVESDPNIPPSGQKNAGHDPKAHAQEAIMHHPYTPEPPYMYRAYMADSGPASIAVHLPGNLSYCWDADACVLRYAWEGGFIDNAGLWKGKPNAVAKVLGTVFYRNKTGANIRVGSPDALSTPEFKGYRMKDRYPEFHYSIDGLDVFELITVDQQSRGLIRTFRIPETQKNVWFNAAADIGVSYKTSTGSMTNNSIMLTPSQARQFSITMTKTGKRE